ncbi:hypothetical protein ACWGR4_01495 [Embleya sp. NPDC055664]
MSASVHRRPGHGPGFEKALPLDSVRKALDLLVACEAPLSIDGGCFPGLPARRITLGELQGVLLRRDCPLATRDAVWEHLVVRARTDGMPWNIACCGMALPALAAICAWMSRRFPDSPYDIHAEVLAGFLAGLRSVDVDRPGIMIRLRWTAFRAGYAALHEALDAPMPIAPGTQTPIVSTPDGHLDLVLARAVRWGVLTRTEADLIGTTRLDRVRIADWARTHERTVGAAYKARRRAEQRLVAFLREPPVTTDATDPVAGHVLAEPLPAATSPRFGRPMPAPPSRSVAGNATSASPAHGSLRDRMSKSPRAMGLPLHKGASPARPRISSEADRCA